MPTTSSSMKAMAVGKFGNSDKLTLHSLPVPMVDAGEVLIRVAVVGIGIVPRRLQYCSTA